MVVGSEADFHGTKITDYETVRHKTIRKTPPSYLTVSRLTVSRSISKQLLLPKTVHYLCADFWMKKTGLYIVFLLGIFVLPLAVQAQTKISRRDSMRILRDTMNVYIFNRQALMDDGLFVKDRLDTTLRNFHVYNPVTAKYGAILTDNLGRPNQPAFFEVDSTRGFTLRPSFAEQYLFRGGERRYYRTKRPYSELGYSIGSAGQKKNNRTGEQTFYILHTQPISKTVQLGIEFKRITSVGFYQRQWASYSNIRAFATYYNKKENYGIAADFVFNNALIEENGGISSQVNFKDQTVTNIIEGDTFTTSLSRKFGYPINLIAAENQQQTYELFVKQFYRVGVKSFQPDTNKPAIKLPLFQIDNTIRIKTDRRRYIDSLTNNFYDTAYIDTSNTFYRTYHREVNMDLEFSFYPLRKKGLANKISAGITGALFDIKQDANVEVNYNVSLFSKLNFFIDSLRYVRAVAEYNILGYNQNDLNIKALVHLGFNNKKKQPLFFVEPGFIFRLQEPGYLWQTTYSNRFVWNNNFKKTRTLGVYADIAFPKYLLKLSGRFYNVGNMLYYDQDAIAQQASQEVVIFQVMAEYDLPFSKKRFHFVNRGVFQQANSSLIRLAPFYLKSSFYYENFLFKKALLLQAGFDIYYGLGYNGYGYNPALATFYLQNNAQIGNYPYLDVYVSAKIKRFKMFIHAGHLNQGFPKPAYFTTAGYPMQDRSFRIGFNWGLFN